MKSDQTWSGEPITPPDNRSFEPAWLNQPIEAHPPPEAPSNYHIEDRIEVVCDQCSAVVSDTDKHTEWHNKEAAKNE